MNTKNENSTRIRIDEEPMQSQMRQPQRKKPNQGVLRILRFGMLASGAVIVVVALALILLPMIKINKIVVEGNDYHNDEYVIEHANIAVGDELFGWDMQKSCDAIKDNYACAEHVYVSIVFPFTVKIEIVEKAGVMYTSYQNQYFSFDRDLRVLEIVSNGEEAFSPFLRVKLPSVVNAQKGFKIQFLDSQTDMSYIIQLLDLLAERNLLEQITYVDFSDRFSLSFVLSDSVRVEIGALKEMNIKLTLLDQLVQNHISQTECVEIDVSDINDPTRRQIEPEHLFD